MGIDLLCDVSQIPQKTSNDCPSSSAHSRISVEFIEFLGGICITSCKIKDTVYIRTNRCQIELFVKGNVEQGVLNLQSTSFFLENSTNIRLDLNHYLLLL